MSELHPRDLKRFAHRRGQALLSRDFNDKLADAAHRRWWHNRAMHNAYGVATGFDVVPVMEAGAASSDEPTMNAVTVHPGVAYDIHGREVVLQSEVKLALPPVEHQSWVLLARYQDRSHLPATRYGMPYCGHSRLESPQFAWKPKHLFTHDDGIPLAAGEYTNGDGKQTQPGEFLIPVSCVPRAPRIAQPRLERGATVPGKTPWKSLKPQWDLPYLVFLRTSIATTPGRFVDVEIKNKAPDSKDSGESRRHSVMPVYIASIRGMPADGSVLAAESTVNETVGGFDVVVLLIGSQDSWQNNIAIHKTTNVDAWTGKRPFSPLDVLAWSYDPIQSFNVLLAALSASKTSENATTSIPDEGANLRQFAQKHLYVQWMGIQMAGEELCDQEADDEQA